MSIGKTLRPIVSTFMSATEELLKVNRSLHPELAVLNCN